MKSIMDLHVAEVLLKNLLSRIDMQEDGSGTLTGRLTADELEAFRMAVGLVEDAPTADGLSGAEGLVPEQPPSPSVIAKEVDEPDAGIAPKPSSPKENFQVKLDLSSLRSSELSDDARICLDFGTAMSKAALVVDDPGTEQEHIRVLPLGVPGNQEEVSETMLISSVYIDNNGMLRFGKAAVDYSMLEGADGTRGRLDNIKRRLSEEGWNEQVDDRFNPTGLPVSYGDMVLAYLSFLTWTVNDCLEKFEYPRNLPRRFAVPCFSGERRHEVLHRLKEQVGEAQVLADTFNSKFRDGISLRDFVDAKEALRRKSREYLYVLKDVVEPLGVANSITSWTARINSLVLVIDIGAGTSDLSLYRLNIDPDRNQSEGIEVEGSSRVLTEAGNHLDRLLIALAVKKSGITSTDDRWVNVHGALELRVREFKESLFRDGSVFIAVEDWIEVEIGLDEFLGLEAVRRFGDDLRSQMVDILESVDESWVNWIRANPQRYLTVVLTGGGAELPMVKELTEKSIGVNGVNVPVKRSVKFPPWLRDFDENLEADYPRVAVSLGGARKRLIERGRPANITGGDVVRPPIVTGYFQKGSD